MMTIEQQKAALRQSLKEQRAALDPAQAARWDSAIARNLLQSEAFARADVVFLYLAVRGEVETQPILGAALAAGKRVAAPVCGPGGWMEFRCFAGTHQFAPGRFGIPEPLGSCPVARATADSLCLVPGLAFDRRGFRLGYGGGYYDRFLPTFPGRAVGLVRSAFLLEHLPADAFDQRVSAFVCEQGWREVEML